MSDVVIVCPFTIASGVGDWGRFGDWEAGWLAGSGDGCGLATLGTERVVLRRRGVWAAVPSTANATRNISDR